MNSEASADQQAQSDGMNADPAPQGNQAAAAAKIKFMKRKVFNDPIHGHIEIHPVCVRIVDTPQLQRLRYIRQLDACYQVYPGASHNRFEHALGTCFLAGKLMKTLQERQPEENITSRDILCVEIAGLCHDLGQGPFSHVFEKRFMQRKKKNFTHEETAKKMFVHMLKDNNWEVKKDIQRIISECKIEDFKQFEERDFEFIKEMIDNPKDIEGEDWPYKGRDETKSFMYEIVANKRNGIDVHKWDYLARDSYMLGMKVSFDYKRCLMSARVLRSNGCDTTNGTNGNTGSNVQTERNETGGTDESSEANTARHDTVARKQICYREKDAYNLYDMFYTRMTLHRRAYQHRTSKIIEMMISDALFKANESVTFVGTSGNELSISDTVGDMPAFTQLTDNVLQIILYASANSPDKTKNENLLDAKRILNNIFNRKLYKFVSYTHIKDGKFDETKFKEEVLPPLNPIEENSIDVDMVELDYGLKNRDPLEKVRFYDKENYDTARKLQKHQVSYVLPETFSEHVLRVYYKGTGTVIEQEQRIERILQEFNKWCRKYGHPVMKESSRKRRNTTADAPERDTHQSATRSESDRNQSPMDDEGEELKQIPEPNTVPANDENMDEETEDMGVDIRSRDAQDSI